MAQTTVLAAGTSEATSSQFTVAATAVTVALYATGGELPATAALEVQQVGPSSAVTPVGSLSKSRPSAVVSGPGVFQVKRPAGLNVSVGVYTET